MQQYPPGLYVRRAVAFWGRRGERRAEVFRWLLCFASSWEEGWHKGEGRGRQFLCLGMGWEEKHAVNIAANTAEAHLARNIGQ